MSTVDVAVVGRRKAPNVPECSPTASLSAPPGRSPPSGERFSRKIECGMCPGRLKANVFFRRIEWVKSPDGRAGAGAATAARAPLGGLAFPQLTADVSAGTHVPRGNVHDA